MNNLALVVALMILMPAIFLAFMRSSWLIDYMIAVFALNRGVRRYVDYLNDTFDPYSPISLTQLVVGALAVLMVLIFLREDLIGKSTISALLCYGAACVLALAVGVVVNRTSAIYEFGSYIAPFGLIGYSAAFAGQPRVMGRWAISLTVIAIIVSGYGLYQYYTIPPWDAMWVRKTGLVGYLGNLRPTEMTVFSTMHERGPLAMFLAWAIMLLFAKPETLGVFRWPVKLLLLVVLLLTYVRTALIQIVLCIVVLPIVNKGAGLFRLIALSAIVLIIWQPLMSALPTGDKIVSRVETLGAVHQEGSVKGRVYMFGTAMGFAATEPLGWGFGAGGMAGRLGAQNTVHGDATGYSQILRTFGWLGTGLIVFFLYSLWRASVTVFEFDESRFGYPDASVVFFRAWLVSGMAVLFSGNWLEGISFFWILAGYVLGRKDEIDSLSNFERAYEMETDHYEPVGLSGT